MAFLDAYNALKGFEGGISNSPYDRGGPTAFGISSKYFPDDYAAVMALVESGQDPDQYLQNFYKTNFWDAAGIETLPPQMQVPVFDTAVNSGIETAQNLLNQASDDPNAYLDLRQQYVNDIVANDPSQNANLEGWSNRIESLRPSDFSGLSDAELAEIAGVQLPQSDLSGLSDAELAEIAGITLEQPNLTETTVVEAAPKIDKLGSFGIGLADTASFGLDDELRGFGRALGTKIRGDERSFSDLRKLGVQSLRDERNIAETTNPGSFLGGQLTGAIAPAFSTPGAAIANWAGRGALGARVAKGSALGALSGGAYGFGSGEGGVTDRAMDALPYAASGGALGGAFPLAGAGLKAGGDAIKERIAPEISKAGAQVAQLAKKYNIPLGLDDVTDSVPYKTLISEGRTLPGGRVSQAADQNAAFTKAISKSIGANTDKLTPDVIKDSFEKLGKEFDNYFKGKSINLGEDFGLGLRQKDFIEEVSDLYSTPGKETIEKYITQINSAIQPDGSVDGNILGQIRSRVSSIARQSKNPEISSAARDIENFIIDSVADVSEEGAKEAFKKTKYQYKNLIAIEPLAAKNQIDGQIPAAQLLGRVKQVYGRSFSKGDAGELGDLANIGQYIKESIPNSGTSQRTGARKLLSGDVLRDLALAGGATAINPAAGAVVAGTQLAGRGLGYLGNRALQNRNMDPKVLESALRKLGQKQPDSLLRIAK